MDLKFFGADVRTPILGVTTWLTTSFHRSAQKTFSTRTDRPCLKCESSEFMATSYTLHSDPDRALLDQYPEETDDIKRLQRW